MVRKASNARFGGLGITRPKEDTDISLLSEKAAGEERRSVHESDHKSCSLLITENAGNILRIFCVRPKQKKFDTKIKKSNEYK